MPKSWTEVMKAVDARSIHAAPFPFDVTLDQLAAFFKTWGTVNQIRMQRWPSSKLFKGTAFVEMSTQAEADALLSANAKYAGAPLRTLTKPAYSEQLAEVRHSRGE